MEIGQSDYTDEQKRLLNTEFTQHIEEYVEEHDKLLALLDCFYELTDVIDDLENRPFRDEENKKLYIKPFRQKREDCEQTIDVLLGADPEGCLRLGENDSAMIECHRHAIVPIKMPQRVDDWAWCISDTAKSFERRHGYTPNEAQLWCHLIKSPANGYEIDRDSRGKQVTLSLSGRSLTRDGFGDRYKLYYPMPK